MSNMETAVNAGMENPVHGSQNVFRSLLRGMSEPCQVLTQNSVKNAPAPLNNASYAIALTLLDGFTRVALSDSLHNNEVIFSLRFHTSSPLVDDTRQADLMFSQQHETPQLDTLNPGSENYPDQSCTLLIQCTSFEQGLPLLASGPGILGQRPFRCSAISDSLLKQRSQMQPQFPLGIDMIFTCGDQFLCLPRSTDIRQESSSCM